MNKLMVLLAALVFTAAAAAQQYKWVDDDGKVRYGDTPPAGVKATRLKQPAAAQAPAPPAKDAASKDKALTPEAAFRKRQQEREQQEEKAAKERAAAEAKRQNCEQAQANLRQLQGGQRIATLNAAGERAFLEDGQRAREAERAQKAVSEWCGS
ncbi:MAG TPA: DUF4124 domain-containing protein [Burkholderiales bacterium]|jgi:hypothetical protein